MRHRFSWCCELSRCVGTCGVFNSIFGNSVCFFDFHVVSPNVHWCHLLVTSRDLLSCMLKMGWIRSVSRPGIRRLCANGAQQQATFSKFSIAALGKRYVSRTFSSDLGHWIPVESTVCSQFDGLNIFLQGMLLSLIHTFIFESSFMIVYGQSNFCIKLCAQVIVSRETTWTFHELSSTGVWRQCVSRLLCRPAWWMKLNAQETDKGQSLQTWQR